MPSDEHQLLPPGDCSPAEKARCCAALERLAHSVSAPSSTGLKSGPRAGLRYRVAVVCGPDRKFINDIVTALRAAHEVRTVFFDKQIDPGLLQQTLDWADVTWFEWCDRILVNASQRLRKTSRVICRLHRYEAFTDVPRQVRWSFVDRLVLVGQPMCDVLRRFAPGIENQVIMQVIENGVDLAAYPFTARAPGFNLAYVGYLNHRKNPALLLQCVRALVDTDPRYSLHIAGVHQQSDHALYFDHMVGEMNLGGHVKFDGWVADVSAWLADKHYIVSTSIHESFGYGIAEAMACGIKPIIHNFPGATAIYPRAWLFNTVSDFVNAVRHGQYAPVDYRRFIAERYSLDRQLTAIGALVAALGADPAAPSAPAGGSGPAVSTGED